MHMLTRAGIVLLGVITLVVLSRVQAEDHECRGMLGAVTIAGKLLVPDDAACTLKGTTVQGGVVVKSRATLRASGVSIVGSVEGEGPRRIVVTGSKIGGSIQVSKLESQGEVSVSTSQVTGDVQLQDNRGLVVLRKNAVTGSVQANKNAGGVELTDNQIGNGLQCQGNRPPPTGHGNTAKQKQGQCVSL